MTQCCYKTHREDPRNFPKIGAVSTSQRLRGHTKGISNKYLNATPVINSSVFNRQSKITIAKYIG